MPIVDTLKDKIRAKGGSAYGVHTIDEALKTLNRMENTSVETPTEPSTEEPSVVTPTEPSESGGQ